MKRILFLTILLMITLTACTQASEYTITFDTVGGTEIPEIVLGSDQTLTLPDPPTKEGYEFDGWYLDEDYQIPYTSDLELGESLTLYAKFNPYINITLYHTDDDIHVLENFNGTVSEIPSPTLSGYTFGGWYLDLEGTEVAPESTVFEEDTTLYAKWIPVSNYLYLVFREYALGRLSIDYQEEFILEDITLNGFTFDGWFSDPELTIPISSIVGKNETMYVYAKFTQEVMNFPVETDLDLTTLGYYSYLDDANPVIHINVRDIGTMSLQLFPDVAPNTVNNMISYVESLAYTGSTFHRIIADFMIQGGIVSSTSCPIEGDFSGNGIVNNVAHTRGALSMARTSVMNSATSQFFIVHADSLFLDGNYATFGGLVNGFHVLDYIATLTTSSSDAPIRDVIIDSMTIDYNGYVPAERICAN